MTASSRAIRPRPGRVGAALARFRRETGGIAAVEFALILPVMVAILLGMSSVTGGLNRDRKLVLLSRSLADLASRVPSISTADMTAMFSAAGAIMQPYTDSVSTTQMVISSIKVTTTNNVTTGTVQWSCAKNIPSPAVAGNLIVRPVNSTYVVPSGFTSTTSFILVETQLPYTPGYGSVITGTINLKQTTPWPVRNVDYVELSGSCPS